MPYKHAPNTGSFWATPKQKISKTTNKPYNAYSGSCLIDGKDYWINGVMSQTNAGPVYKLNFSPKDPINVMKENPKDKEIPMNEIPF